MSREVISEGPYFVPDAKARGSGDLSQERFKARRFETRQEIKHERVKMVWARFMSVLEQAYEQLPEEVRAQAGGLQDALRTMKDANIFEQSDTPQQLDGLYQTFLKVLNDAQVKDQYSKTYSQRREDWMPWDLEMISQGPLSELEESKKDKEHFLNMTLEYHESPTRPNSSDYPLDETSHIEMYNFSGLSDGYTQHLKPYFDSIPDKLVLRNIMKSVDQVRNVDFEDLRRFADMVRTGTLPEEAGDKSNVAYQLLNWVGGRPGGGIMSTTPKGEPEVRLRYDKDGKGTLYIKPHPGDVGRYI